MPGARKVGFSACYERFPYAPPDLAVEGLSPSETTSHIERKVRQYIEAGTTAVWLFDMKKRRAAVHHRSAPMRMLGEDDVLDQSDLLTGYE